MGWIRPAKINCGCRAFDAGPAHAYSRKRDLARDARPGNRMGFGAGPRCETGREPRGRVAPYGETARPGIRIRGQARPRVPAGIAPGGAACGVDRHAAQGQAEGIHADRSGRGGQHERRGGPAARIRKGRAIRGLRAAADAGSRPVRQGVAQRIPGKPLRELCLPPARASRTHADLHPVDGGQHLRTDRQFRPPDSRVEMAE